MIKRKTNGTALVTDDTNSAPVTSAPPITRRTFVVLGCPRGGTSLIAGALHATGVYMGEYPAAEVEHYEDQAFKISPVEARRDKNIDVRLSPIIQQRNISYRYWGWKLPDSIYYIRKIQHLLINPVFIFVYRDQEAIARSSAKHDGKTWWIHKRRLRRVAHVHTRMVAEFEQSLDSSAPRASFQVEDVQQDIAAFQARLADLIHPLELNERAVARFVNPGGGYVPPSAAE